MRPLIRLLLLAVLLASPALAAETPGNSFAIRDVRLFDGHRTIEHANVIVRDGRISAAAPGATIPSDIAVIDGSGETLLPGLIDSHVHVFPGAQADALRFGVTTELDMFNFTHEFRKWRAQRESLARTTEADTWSAGTGVTAPGGHPTQMMPAGTPIPTLSRARDADSFAAARIAEGSDYIKLILEDFSMFSSTRRLPTLSRAEVCASVRAAHARGKLVLVHVARQSDAREALICGADGLAHMFIDSVATPAFVRLALAHHAFIVGTLDVPEGFSDHSLTSALVNDPRVAPYLSSRARAIAEQPHTVAPPAALGNALESIRILHRAGVPILVGTDAPAGGWAHGASLHRELALLVRGGLTPEEALNAATQLPARIFHLGDRGRIAPGFRADLVLVAGNPARNVGDSLDIRRIWKNGYAVDRMPQ